MDSILKKDKVFYINVTYYLALRAAERMKRGLGKRADAERMRAGADRLHAQFQDRFWSGRYFSDWLRGDRRGGFASDGNVLAILFGIATDAQAREILGFIAEHGLDADAPLATCHPVYTLRQVYPLYFAAGIPDYHRTMIWPWLGTLNAVNKHRLGSPTDAVADLARIGEWYIRRGAVGETYDRQGNPISRRFYHSEVPFAWHAGLYVYAVHAIGAAPGAATDPIPSAAAAERPTGPREGTPVPVL
jgi:glycogen debranching enzyme